MTTALQQRPLANGQVIVPSDPITLGNVLARSGFFADSRDAAQAAVKVMAGQELGFGPVASMTGIYIVKGRVTLSANLMAAAIRNSRRYDFRVREHTDKTCRIEFYGPKLDGPGMEQLGASEFTMNDAQKAGLAGSEAYRKFPRNMLYARALSNGAKWYCPDVFGGGPAYTPDELTDQVTYDTDGQIVAVVEDAAPPPPPTTGNSAAATEPQQTTQAVTADPPQATEKVASARQRGLINAKAAEKQMDPQDLADALRRAVGQEPRMFETSEAAQRWINRQLDRLPARLVDPLIEAIDGFVREEVAF